MSVRERILAIRLLEKQTEYPEHAEALGVSVRLVRTAQEGEEEKE